MSKNKRASHAVRGFTLKVGQVEKAREKHGRFVWLEFGETFRDATPAESLTIQAEYRHKLLTVAAEIARLREPLPYLEWDRFPVMGIAAVRDEMKLAAQARIFAMSAI